MKRDAITKSELDFEVVILRSDELREESFFISHLHIIRCDGGEATIEVNAQQYYLQEGVDVVLPHLVVLKVLRCSDNFAVTVCRFSAAFLNNVFVRIDHEVIDLLRHINNYEPMPTSAPLLIIAHLVMLYNNPAHHYREQVAVNLVVNYLLEKYELAHHYTESFRPSISNYVNATLSEFYRLCRLYHAEQRHVEFYANELNITSRYLHKITKEGVNLTPKNIIDNFVIGSAKKLLITTSSAVGEISDQLNFPDQATFAYFFKHKTGITPLEFRNSYK